MTSLIRPIFILGMMQRTGTNYLYDLLRLHPDTHGSPPWEDHLLRYAHQLTDYVDNVSSYWDPAWGASPEVLRQSLGDGLCLFLSARSHGRRPLTKTPSLRGIANFFHLFPEAHLLITVRDGRATIESGVRTFGWNYEDAMHKWASAARDLLAFNRNLESTTHKCLIVRYEDLCTHPGVEMARILRYCELSSDAYDFGRVTDLPVRGSSTLRTSADDAVDWRPVAKTADFEPLRRWQHRSRRLHERFNWIAGAEMRELGYELRQYGGQSARWNLWNRALDLRWRMKRS